MPNNPPSPVLENVEVVVRSETECNALKAKFGVKSGTHGTNPPETSKQSHHIFQNAAMVNSNGVRLITAYSGQAVMLFGGSSVPGSEHAIANALQSARTRAGTKIISPTFGDLKRVAKADLAAAFREAQPARGGMTNKEAEKLADCLVIEAEKALEEFRKKNGLKPAKLGDANRTTTPRGCFAAGTPVWLDETQYAFVESLHEGAVVKAREGPRTVIRARDCVSSLIEINVGDSSVVLSPTHRVRLINGRYIFCDALRRGHKVDTLRGPRNILSTYRHDGTYPIFSFGVGERTECQVGLCGLWIEVPDSGPKISDHVSLRVIPLTEEKTCQT